MARNKPIIITGCQRSGTTLLNLILDSHPQIRSLDEMEYDGARLGEYLTHPDYHPSVAFKLPGDVPFFRSFKALPGVKVLWCVRDPRDVVLSMINLKVEKLNGQDIVWANHDLCAMREIEHCLPHVDSQRPPAGIEEYHRIGRIPQLLRGRRDAVVTAALCWSLKNWLLDFYAGENLPVMVVPYEGLVSNPEQTMKEVLSFLELPWHADVLRHHELHDKMYAGNTHGNRPIDSSGIGGWRRGLTDAEVALIGSICAEGAEKFGYRLPLAGNNTAGQTLMRRVFAPLSRVLSSRQPESAGMG